MRQPPTSPRITKGTFGEVLAEYEKHCVARNALDPDNRQYLADGSLSQYKAIIRWCHSTLGKYSASDPVNGIRPKLVQAALDTLMDMPGLQSNARAMLGALDTWAAPREHLVRSIIYGVKVAGSDGGHTPWSDAQVGLGEQNARIDLSRAISLMVHTGQRGSDIVRMKLADLSEERDPTTGHMLRGINVTTKKVGLQLWIPFTEELVELVDAWMSDIRQTPAPWYLVTKTTRGEEGQPFTRPQISEHWGDERANNEALAPIRDAGLVLHGLRGTCVVRHRKAGATPLEIGSRIGMSPKMVERYCRFADRVDLAIAAVHRLGVRTNRERLRNVHPVSDA